MSSEDTIFSSSYLQRVASERNSKRLQICMSASIDVSCPTSPQHSPTHQPCKITVLIIVVHGGSLLGKPFRSAFTSMSGRTCDLLNFLTYICIDMY
jgi:hypothetical protein